MTNNSSASLIDHTLLKPDARLGEIKKLCKEADQYHFHSVCVNPCWVSAASSSLADSDVKVCTVISFPFGASLSRVKAFETEQAIQDGATEVDMVLNIGQALDGNWDYVAKDIQAVAEAAHAHSDSANNPIVVKVILETCLLDDDQIVHACKAAVSAGADFVKTSTGFSSGGATVHDVALMRETVGPDLGVKASGGIHTREDFQAMVKAGANRIGASAGVDLI
ncbi:deoxyribose-phosphate aldolase [Bifidobacterium sp.]|uniref:deoxyribose-phosphate aldolase n=1 Tax=Bifidobacterium sp. TaxID=41200 RepID=UPI0039EA2719